MVRQLILRPGGLEKQSMQFNRIILLIVKKCLRKIDILTDRIKIRKLCPLCMLMMLIESFNRDKKES